MSQVERVNVSGQTGKPVTLSFLCGSSQRPRHRDAIAAWCSRSDVYAEAPVDVSTSSAMLQRVKRLKKYLPGAFNIKRVPLQAEALWYTWGAIPWSLSLSEQSDYIIELDNPYALTGYQVSRFRRMKSILGFALRQKRCRAIVCMSEACQRNLILELGDDLLKKTHVLYPYVSDPGELYVRRGCDTSSEVSFCSFASSPCARGVPSLVAAIAEVEKHRPDVRFTLVMPQEAIERFRPRVSSNVAFLPYSLSRSSVFETLDSHDALIHSSLQDSFGMIVLEALSRGMPILSTSVYALSEMVHHGKQGILIDAPLDYYTKEGVANEHLWRGPFEKHAPQEADSVFVNELVSGILKLCCHHTRKKMSQKSRDHFLETFSPQIWHERAEQILATVRRS